MPPNTNRGIPVALNKPPKRKEPPQSSSNGQNKPSKARSVKRVRMDARTIATQNSDAALNSGSLDLHSFLKAREFEIKALEDGMQKSKSSLMKRAFQLVPRDMRRRTASHNVKKVPKRMQKRAAREMQDDNTPIVDRSKRKPGNSRGRLRAETAKRLGILAAKKRAERAKNGKVTKGLDIRAARPKIRKNKPNDPPKPVSKFRKRQIHKTWLPTHMWHAKRARMTEPKNPLWRFAIPTTSTEKSYRPTHRAIGARGAVAWDMSYMSTIALEGAMESIEKLLKEMGINDQALWNSKGEKWRSGKRSWSGWLSKGAEEKSLLLGPSTIIWCTSVQESDLSSIQTARCRLFVRIHPSVFQEAWNELLRLSAMQRPQVCIEDLRFEIGSISITGPGSTEALLGILHPYHEISDSQDKYGQTFQSLAGVSNPGSLPPNAVLAFSVMDPRLRYPPRPTKLPSANDENANFALLEMLSNWPVDAISPSCALIDRDARFRATRLPAQKVINYRKGQAEPGEYPIVINKDPSIPIMLYTSRTAVSASAQGTWTLLAPWKCIQPIWYGLVHVPLSSGGNPRFGGLDELRQTHFEHGVPWFPADFPGTEAGFSWEIEEREKRKAAWDRTPKGKRVEWDSLDLGAGRKGEVGRGWTCDFERLVGMEPLPHRNKNTETAQDSQDAPVAEPKSAPIPRKSPIRHIGCRAFTSLFSSFDSELPPNFHVATVRITLTTRGVAIPCARVYRLPRVSESADNSTTSSPPSTTREEWLCLLPQPKKSKPTPNLKSEDAKIFIKNHGRMPLDVPIGQRVRLLAQSLLQEPPLPYPANREDEHPLVPDEEDLIGFVTTGEFNLAEGKGVAIATFSVAKVLEGMRQEGKGAVNKGRLCIVRNSGEKIGRLATWEAV